MISSFLITFVSLITLIRALEYESYFERFHSRCKAGDYSVISEVLENEVGHFCLTDALEG